MGLRAAGQTRIRTHDSDVSSRIASEAGQLVKFQSPWPGVADRRPYHLGGHSLKTRVRRVTSFLNSIKLMKMRNGECSDKNESFFDNGINFRIDSDFRPPGILGSPEIVKEANLFNFKTNQARLLKEICIFHLPKFVHRDVSLLSPNVFRK